MSVVSPVAVFPVEGTPDWQVLTDDSVWVTNGPKNTVHRLDVKTNTVSAVVEVGKRPCSGLAWGFGSIWVPNCGDNTLSRIDTRTNEVVATLPYGPANSEGGIAASMDSVWMLTDKKGVLSRIDPSTNKVVAEIQVPSGSYSCVLGDDGAIWISSTENNQVSRVDPKLNKMTDTIDVGPQPRFLTAGAGSIWTLNQGDGTVSRVDVKTKKLVTNIQVGIPGTGGERVWRRLPVGDSVRDSDLADRSRHKQGRSSMARARRRFYPGGLRHGLAVESPPGKSLAHSSEPVGIIRQNCIEVVLGGKKAKSSFERTFVAHI
jgi:YVTN family beta-propeller protein